MPNMERAIHANLLNSVTEAQRRYLFRILAGTSLPAARSTALERVSISHRLPSLVKWRP
jgi:hypothetical protein